MSTPDLPLPPHLPCAHCGEVVPCALADQAAGPCAGPLHGYYVDAATRVHLCAAHAPLWATHAAARPRRPAAASTS